MTEAAATNRPAAAGAFAPAVVVAIALIGFLAFIAYVVLGAYESDFRSGNNGRTHAMSKSAVGYAGIVELLEDTGYRAQIARGDEADLEGYEATMVLTPDVWDTSGERFLDLPTTRAFGGSILVVLPKWIVSRGERPGWVRKFDIAEVDPGRIMLLERDEDVPFSDIPEEDLAALSFAEGEAAHTFYHVEDDSTLKPIRTGPIDRLQTLSRAPGWTPIIEDEDGGVLLAWAVRDGVDFYVLSDPDLINNHGLANLETATAGLTVLDQVALGAPIFFDVTLHGLERSRSPLKLLLEPPFLPATLCAFAAALLMMWHAARRFGAARRAEREFALGKTALADNQAGLIRMAGREPHMGKRYADLMRDLTARAVGAPRNLEPDELETFLDRLGEGRTKARFSDLRGKANATPDNNALMDAAERLHQWRLEMTRERD